MAGQTTSTFSDLFKIDYWDARRESTAEIFFRSKVILSRLRRKPMRLAGKYLEVPVHTTRTRSGGPRSEEATLPVATNQAGDTFQFTPIDIYWPLRLTGQVIRRAARNQDAFWTAVDFEVQNARKDLSDEMNRQCYGDGGGAFTTVRASSGGASTTIAVEDASHLEPGMTITVLNVADGTALQAGGTTYTPSIVGVNHAARTIEVSGAMDTAVYASANNGTGHVIVRAGVTGTTCLVNNNAMWGLGLICKDLAGSYNGAYGLGWGENHVTYAGVTRNATTFQWACGNVFDGSGGVTESLLARIRNTIELRAGGKTSLIITSEEQWRGLAEELKKNAIGQLPIVELKFGYRAIMWQGGNNKEGIPIVWDAHCPRNKMFLLDESTLYFGETEGLGFMNFDGQTWVNDRTVDAYTAMLMWSGNLVCTNPRANALITNLKLGTPAF